MDRLRTVVLASPDRSDIYFANQMRKSLNVVGVVIERQYASGRSPERLKKVTKLLGQPTKLLPRIRDTLTMASYFRRTERIDAVAFGRDLHSIPETENCKVIHTVGARSINQPRYVEIIRALQPDVITICGSSILKEPILSIPPRGVLNLHGGLSQFYRGVWTTLWAVYNREPEYVGCTVHYVTPGIDDGDIVYQGRPRIEVDDNEESLYTKVVKLGTSLMIQAIQDMEMEGGHRYPLRSKGKLYLEKMVTPQVIRTVRTRIAEGVFSDYLRKKEERDRGVLEVLKAHSA